MKNTTATRREFLTTLGLGVLSLGLANCAGPVSLLGKRPRGEDAKPNFIIIFTDDQGYNDLGCFGSETIKTPRIDQMAREGMKLTSFYAQPVCGPARCSLLTGCYPERVKGFGSHSLVHWGVAPDEITIAEILRQTGYATACIGKWDLSYRRFEPEMGPNDQGFDYYFGTLRANDAGKVTLWRNKEELQETDDMGALTGMYTDEALQFIAEKKDQPFFLYLAHTMPHAKLGASEKFRGKSENGLYGDVIEEIDWNTGRILDRVRELNLENKTYIVFLSDNGPWLILGNDGGSAKPLRDGKGSSWEGGVRVPCIVWGPGRVPAGAQSNELAATLDILPTFAALAGATAPSDRVIDGRDQSALITGKTNKSARDTFYYYVGGNLHAVRQGQWKLALPDRKRSYAFAKDDPPITQPELYDMGNDIEEKHDVSADHSGVVKGLLRLADKAREDLGDLMTLGKNSRRTMDNITQRYPPSARP
ncbi:sulfatase [Candidatus Hydrogenedentota bacterium]